MKRIKFCFSQYLPLRKPVKKTEELKEDGSSMPVFGTQKSYWQQEISRKEKGIVMIKIILLLSGIVILFYADFRMFPITIPFGYYYYRHCMEKLLVKKKQIFERQFHDALQTLEAHLNVGYSMENAIKETKRELLVLYKNSDAIVKEFTYMSRQLNLNVTVEQVWRDFARRVDLPAVNNFVVVLIQAKRSGGDSISIIKETIRRLSERAEIKEEIETIIAARRLEFQIMTIIPFGIIAYMKISFPDFMNVLYSGLFGKCFMSVCLIIYFFAWRLGCYIVEIEV